MYWNLNTSLKRITKHTVGRIPRYKLETIRALYWPFSDLMLVGSSFRINGGKAGGYPNNHRNKINSMACLLFMA